MCALGRGREEEILDILHVSQMHDGHTQKQATVLHHCGIRLFQKLHISCEILYTLYIFKLYINDCVLKYFMYVFITTPLLISMALYSYFYIS